MRLLSRLLQPRAFIEPPFWAQPDRLFTALTGAKESIGNDFNEYVRKAFKGHGPVFTTILVRMMVFSEIRFQWQRLIEGRPGELFGTPALSLLETPWPNGTTGELLSRMEQDSSLAGNFYGARVDGDGPARIRRLRPNTVTIVTGSPSDDPYDYRAKPVGYIYDPRRLAGSTRAEPTLFTPDRVVHYSPLPDPDAQWRGMSWLTPIIEEVRGDKAATSHKLKFFEHGTISGLAVTYSPEISTDDFQEYVRLFQEEHEGPDNAYRTLHFGGGADPKPISANMQQLDFKALQGVSETRIAAASGLGAVMAQFSEGLAGSSLNTGNFTAARKRAETILFRPLWRIAAASLAPIVQPAPDGARLWYDPRDVAFLRDDAKEEAAIRRTNASTIETLIRSGATFDSAVSAVTSGDFVQLEDTGLRSVQLVDPNQEATE
jgi:hypothetical protein